MTTVIYADGCELHVNPMLSDDARRLPALMVTGWQTLLPHWVHVNQGKTLASQWSVCVMSLVTAWLNDGDFFYDPSANDRGLYDHACWLYEAASDPTLANAKGVAIAIRECPIDFKAGSYQRFLVRLLEEAIDPDLIARLGDMPRHGDVFHTACPEFSDSDYEGFYADEDDDAPAPYDEAGDEESDATGDEENDEEDER